MRLIDADALWKEFDTAYLFDDGNPRHIAQQAVEDAPTVDIKPEVAREIFAEIDKISFRYLSDVDYSFGDVIYDLNELKNKYIGGWGNERS